MIIENCLLSDAVVIIPKRYFDDRGFFSETWSSLKLKNVGLNLNFVQDNHSMSKLAYTFRGFHFQLPPYEQGKLVRVINGSILDIIVDIRSNSKTFGQSYSIILSKSNGKQLYAPPGFAHGFLTLDDETEVLYKTTNYYNQSSERGISYADNNLKINWPVSTKQFIVNDRDMNWPSLDIMEHVF